jgi:hypothetical protein
MHMHAHNTHTSVDFGEISGFHSGEYEDDCSSNVDFVHYLSGACTG